MNINKSIDNLKKRKEQNAKLKLYRKTHGEAITARDLKHYVFDMGVVPTPIYTSGIEYQQIVEPRTIYVKAKKKARLKI